MGYRGERQYMKLAFSLGLLLTAVPTDGLNVGVQATTDSGVYQNKQQCSRRCESEHCTVPPFMRYGKYCGILYSGCAGESPCDALDACCKSHDACIQAHNDEYLSKECNENLLVCVTAVKKYGGATFKGNKCKVEEVADVISVIMEAALLAGRVGHKP